MGSVRVDTAPLIAGACVVSAYSGHGIRGADVPSSGANGPAILFAGLGLPAENEDEFRALILTRPGTLPGLVIGEDSSLDSGAAPPDGVHTGTWRGYKNGVSYGPDPSTYTITIGSAGGELSGGATLDDASAGGGMGGGAPSQLSGGATLDGPGAAGGLTAGTPSQISGGATLDGPAAGGGLEGEPIVIGFAIQPETASSWSYLQTGTLWRLSAPAGWGTARAFATPEWFLCDYAADNKVMVSQRGDEFTTRLLIYTSLPGVKAGDMLLIGRVSDVDPVAAGAQEVKAVAAWADTFNAGGPEDFRIAT